MKKPSPKDDPSVQHKIAERAYFIAMAEGFPSGREIMHWLQAEEQVLLELGAKVLKAIRPTPQQAAKTGSKASKAAPVRASKATGKAAKPKPKARGAKPATKR